MKTMNYIKIGIASSILSIAAGCTSFLEEDLKSSLAPDNTYTSSLGFEVGATGLYAIARSEYNTWGENGAFMHNGACAYEVLQISTDLCRMGTVRDGSLVPFAEMTLNPSTLFVGSYWNWAYNLIASANELLIYSEKNDNWDYPTDKQLYQAEARFFRAYAYRTLVYLYGDVPWVETIQKPFLLSFSRDRGAGQHHQRPGICQDVPSRQSRQREGGQAYDVGRTPPAERNVPAARRRRRL